MNIRYGDMKKQLAEDMISFTTPFREKIQAISSDSAYLKKVTQRGKEKARESASNTLNEARKAIGIRTF
jgi:tryptophanyl-tRNA synthetase